MYEGSIFTFITRADGSVAATIDAAGSFVEKTVGCLGNVSETLVVLDKIESD